jgi:hypothetical protein
MCLPGTSFQIAPIELVDESGGFSKGYERRIHNYLFMDATKATFTKLLARNIDLPTKKIVSTKLLPDLGKDVK